MVERNLEGMSQAQKQLLRMGPENTQVIQTKLRALADRLRHAGLPSAQVAILCAGPFAETN